MSLRAIEIEIALILFNRIIYSIPVYEFFYIRARLRLIYFLLLECGFATIDT